MILVCEKPILRDAQDRVISIVLTCAENTRKTNYAFNLPSNTKIEYEIPITQSKNNKQCTYQREHTKKQKSFTISPTYT